ncbi:MAG: shikimate kinase [Candidatus Omnitrophica bacterium]|nr:shikimate kinase [Candidatus Omnitrophota bacterium]
MKNIYLVGFMGTGKSAVGKKLADKLKAKFLDLDSLIEEKEKRKIVDIFAQDGEAYFRVLEKEILKEVAVKSGLVVACGGGIVLDKDNITLMKNTGKMICLAARPEVILERVKHYRHRPLLNVADKEKKIREILKARQALYNLAHITIDTSDLSIEETAEKILGYLKNDRA